MVSARPLNTISYYQAPIQPAFRNSLNTVLVPGHIFKVVPIPVLYQITFASVPSSSPIPAAPVNPLEPSLSTPAPALEPETELNPQVPSPAEPTLPAPTPDPIPLVRIPVSTRPPGTPHHRQANPEKDEEILNETVEPPSTEANLLDEKNPNNEIQENTDQPTPPSLIHNSGN